MPLTMTRPPCRVEKGESKCLSAISKTTVRKIDSPKYGSLLFIDNQITVFIFIITQEFTARNNLAIPPPFR